MTLVAAGWLVTTVLLYEVLRRWHARRPRLLTLPVLATTLLLGATLVGFELDLDVYARGTRPLAWLLGPSTVALAVPLVRERALLLTHARAVLAGVTAGATGALVTAVLLARAMGLSPLLVRSVAPKSVTTPVAMPISLRLGGDPQITAAVVLATGLFGLALGPRILSIAGVKRPLARGVALGTAAHGIGTAAAMAESNVTGAASAVAMVVSAIVTALLAGPLLRLFG